MNMYTHNGKVFPDARTMTNSKWEENKRTGPEN